MNRVGVQLVLLAATAPVLGQASIKQWFDPPGDATIRRTDPGADGLLHPSGVAPDLVHVSLAGWSPIDPLNDPFTGSVTPGKSAHIFRLTASFRGLVNPPGTLGLNGEDYDPFCYGASPVFGSLDVDIDGRHTGGEIGGGAQQRYLANVGRFGRVPNGELAERTARSHLDLDGNFNSEPFFERSGAEFSLSFCGCSGSTFEIVSGDLDGLFEQGETWDVTGRFFERTQGYSGASGMVGGSDFFLYDPIIDIRFRHSIQSNSTTITVVFPLDMIGAAMLLGGDVQEPNNCVQECAPGGEHYSIVEAMIDVVNTICGGGLSANTETLVGQWKDQDPYAYLDPTKWKVTALFGMAYLEPEDAFYAWTDTGMLDVHGDLDGDGSAGEVDESQFIDGVYALDGQSGDADGAVNGVVKIGIPGTQFNVLDLDGDASIKLLDRYVFGDPADLNDDGDVDLLDFITFQILVHTGDALADFNLDQKVDVFDFVAFQSAASK